MLRPDSKFMVNELLEIRRLLTGYESKLYTVAEAAKYLGISKGYLYKLTSRNEIVFHKPNGKLLYFLKSDLDSWALRNRSKTREELERNA